MHGDQDAPKNGERARIGFRVNDFLPGGERRQGRNTQIRPDRRLVLVADPGGLPPDLF